MTSERKETPPGAPAPDLILLALFQSRLRERSLYLGQVIQSQRRRLSAASRPEHDADGAGDDLRARIRLAEQALAAVQEAEDRLGRGRYGLCHQCEEPIAWDDLLESPEQTTCRGCSGFGNARLKS